MQGFAAGGGAYGIHDLTPAKRRSMASSQTRTRAASKNTERRIDGAIARGGKAALPAFHGLGGVQPGHPELHAGLGQRAVGGRCGEAAEGALAGGPGLDGIFVEHQGLRFWRKAAGGQGEGGEEILGLGAGEVEHHRRHAGGLDMRRQAGHFGGKGAQGGVAAAQIDEGGLPLGDAILDQLLQPGGDTGGVVGVRAGDIGEIGGEGGVARVDIGEDRRAAIQDGGFGEPAEQGGLAGFAAPGGEDDFGPPGEVDALLDLGFGLLRAAPGW